MKQDRSGIEDFYQRMDRLPLNRSIHLKEGCRQRYIIKMQNSYLDEWGNVIKWQRLRTDYERMVEQEIYEFCLLTSLKIERAVFQSDQQKKMNWTFVKDHRIPYFLYSANNEYEIEKMMDASVHGKVEEQVKRFQSSFSEFPKLPSVYLYIMQLYDMIAFENFACFFSGLNISSESMGKLVEIEKLTKAQANIGLNLYSENSVFQNGTFKAMFLGYTRYQEIDCVIFNYNCGKSSVKMEDHKIDEKREGSSYYSGIVLFDLQSGIPIMGTMIENYTAKQNNNNVNVRREVLLKIAGEDPEGDNIEI